MANNFRTPTLEEVFFFFLRVRSTLTNFPSNSFFHFFCFLSTSFLNSIHPLFAFFSSFLQQYLFLPNPFWVISTGPSLMDAIQSHLRNVASYAMFLSRCLSKWIETQLELVLPSGAGVKTMRSNLCRMICIAAPSSTIKP